MKNIFFFFLLLSKFVFTLENEKELIMLVELFRHGTRTPLLNFKNDSWITDHGEGSLTPTGMRQQFVLGQQLRDRYKDFLPEKYQAEWLYVYSTYNNRTIESAFSQLDGLFFENGPNIPSDYNANTNYTHPPIEITVSLSDLSDAALPYHYMDIAVHSNNRNRDLILETTTTCPELTKQVDNSKSSSALYEEAYEDLKDDIDQMADLLGYPHSDTLTFLDGVYMADYMQCFLWNDESLPIDGQDSLFLSADYLLAIDMYYEFEEHSDAETFATGMMSSFLERLETKVEDPDSGYKLVMYSGHDTNVANVMALFNLTSVDCAVEYMQQRKPYGTQI